jgi:protein ImuB
VLWIAVHLPQLSLESFAATLDDAARQRPLALIEAQRITQVDARAAALGIQRRAKRATALALAGDLVLGQADAARDAQALQAVAHAALEFTPMVCVEATDSTGSPAPVVLLEVQASLRCFGGHRRLLDRLRRAWQPLGHRMQMASAPTALGAALLARWRDDLALGAHCTEPAALRRLLDDAPVWLVGPGREHWEALQGMGLRRLSDLRHLPRGGLARRFGPALLADLDRARGDLPDPREPIELPSMFEQRIELFTRADTAEQMMAGARVLIERLLAWARARHARVATFSLRMHHEARRQRKVAASELEIGLAEPSADAAHLQSLLAERLVRMPLVAPALELSLHCDRTVQAAPPNAELFATRGSEREGLTRLIERLQARLGAEGVQQLALQDDYRPERSTASHPADAAQQPNSAILTVQPAQRLTAREPASCAQPRIATAPQRPLWLLNEPQPLPERASRPWLDGAPLQLLAGPERIESGWWDGALAARDYFIARTGDSTLVWVFRARLPLSLDDDSGWFLQGRFA